MPYKKSNMLIKPHLQAAIHDYMYLIRRDYPSRGVLKLVSDRYHLTGRERSLLYRGLIHPQPAGLRRNRLLPDLSAQSPLLVDGFNMLITLASYLQGAPVFVATDGLLRDAAHSRGRIDRNPKLMEAAELLNEFIHEHPETGFMLFLDRQVSMHEKIIGQMTDLANVQVLVSEHTDRELTHRLAGIICTSDSEIIDGSPLPVFDLARYILHWKFNAEPVHLQAYTANPGQ